MENQDYITPVIPNANPPNPNIKPELVVKSAKNENPKEIKPIIPVSELPNLHETVNGSTVAKKEIDPKKDKGKSDSVSIAKM